MFKIIVCVLLATCVLSTLAAPRWEHDRRWNKYKGTCILDCYHKCNDYCDTNVNNADGRYACVRSERNVALWCCRRKEGPKEECLSEGQCSKDCERNCTAEVDKGWWCHRCYVLSPAVIAGIVIGAIVLIIIVVVVSCYCCACCTWHVSRHHAVYAEPMVMVPPPPPMVPMYA